MRLVFYLGIILVPCLLGTDDKEDLDKTDNFLHDLQTRYKSEGYSLI
jgi:hypothetical protein